MGKLYYRENYLKKLRGFYDDTDMIKVITGVRRCGKSSLMEMVCSEILSKGTDQGNSQAAYKQLYVQFLAEGSNQIIDTWIEGHSELTPRDISTVLTNIFHAVLQDIMPAK